MKFPYREYVSEFPGSSDFRLILRPVITVSVAGAKAAFRCDALVDTGADESLLPLRFAELLGVELDHDVGQASGLSGERLTVHYGDVQFQIGAAEEAINWRATAGFVEFDSPGEELIILGHTGCLDYFTASFDGEAATLEISPNSMLPVAIAPSPDV